MLQTRRLVHLLWRQSRGGAAESWKPQRHKNSVPVVASACRWRHGHSASLQDGRRGSLSLGAILQVSPCRVARANQREILECLDHPQGPLDGATMEEALECVKLCSKLKVKDNSLMDAILRLCCKSMGKMNGDQLLALVWVMVRSHYDRRWRSLFHEVVDKMVPMLADEHSSYDPKWVTEFIWSVVTIGHLPDHLKQALRSYLMRNIKTFDLHSLSVSANSLRKADLLDKELIDEAWSAAVACMSVVPPCDAYSMLTQALADARTLVNTPQSTEYYTKLSQLILSTSSRNFLTPRNIAAFAWAFAKNRHYDPALCDHLAAHALDQMDGCKAIDLGNLGYAMGHLNHAHLDLLGAMATRLSSDPTVDRAQACFNVAWACMVADFYPRTLMQIPLSPNFFKAIDRQGFGIYYWQLHLAMTVERPELGIPGLPSPLKEAVQLKCLRNVALFRTPSIFHANVLRALTRVVGGKQFFTSEALCRNFYLLDAEVLLGEGNRPQPVPHHWARHTLDSLSKHLLPHHGTGPGLGEESQDGSVLYRPDPREVSSAVGLFGKVNLGSDWRGLPSHVKRKVAIEADGPLHFASNCNHKLGRTVLKQRQLKAFGWEVLSLPYYDWELLETDADQCNFLANRLFHPSLGQDTTCTS